MVVCPMVYYGGLLGKGLEESATLYRAAGSEERKRQE